MKGAFQWLEACQAALSCRANCVLFPLQASTQPEKAKVEPEAERAQAKAEDAGAGEASAAPDQAEADGSAVVSTLKKSKEAAAQREGGEEVRSVPSLQAAACDACLRNPAL